VPESLRHARVVVTGKLASMARNEAYRVVLEAGGQPSTCVSRQTSMLVVGMGGWPLLPDGTVSSKLRRAEELNSKGYRIHIISELVFLEVAGHDERQPDLRKTYPSPEVCKLWKIEPETLRRWEQFSLVRSQDGLYDFQDLVSLRTIGELVNHGVRPETIAKSLRGLASVLPGTDRPLAQLKIVAENSKSVLADFGEFRVAPDGQLLLNFEGKPRSEAAIISFPSRDLTATEWFEQGQTCEEGERYGEAEEAYRKALSLAPHFPEAYFNLGNVLREIGRLDAAEEMYRMATTQDAAMASVLYNLADIQEERGKLNEAVASLHAALKVSPSYSEAHFNLALCLEKIGRKQEADKHWSAYLKLDPNSEWAEMARQHMSPQMEESLRPLNLLNRSDPM